MQGELEHVTSKEWFRYTNKNNYVKQVAKQEQRRCRLHAVDESTKARHTFIVEGLDMLEKNDPTTHYTRSKRAAKVIQIDDFLKLYAHDPSVKVVFSLC